MSRLALETVNYRRRSAAVVDTHIQRCSWHEICGADICARQVSMPKVAIGAPSCNPKAAVRFSQARFWVNRRTAEVEMRTVSRRAAWRPGRAIRPRHARRCSEVLSCRGKKRIPTGIPGLFRLGKRAACQRTRSRKQCRPGGSNSVLVPFRLQIVYAQDVLQPRRVNQLEPRCCREANV